MKPETEKKLARIKRFSTVLRIACKGLMALAALGLLVGSIAFVVGRGASVSISDISIPLGDLAIRSRLVLLLIFATSMGVAIKAFFHLHRLFGSYSAGNIFSTQTAAQIRQFGITAILWAAMNVIWHIAADAVTHAPGPFQLHLDSLFIGVVIIVISWFMDAAAELREENELTI